MSGSRLLRSWPTINGLALRIVGQASHGNRNPPGSPSRMARRHRAQVKPNARPTYWTSTGIPLDPNPRISHSAPSPSTVIHTRGPLLPPPFRIDCRPERRERDAEFSSDVSPPDRPPSRLPRDRALRAGEHQPIVFRRTLLCRPLVAGRSSGEHTALHRENAARPEPRVVVACLD